MFETVFPFSFLSSKEKRGNSDTMAAAGRGSASSAPAVNLLDLLAVQDSENARAELVRKHDTLKAKMDTLKKQREEQKKQKKALTAALKLAKRQKSRIISKLRSNSPVRCVSRLYCLSLTAMSPALPT